VNLIFTFANQVRAAAELRTPRTSRMLLGAIILLLITGTTWAHFAILDEVKRGQGKVIPSRQIQVLTVARGRPGRGDLGPGRRHRTEGPGARPHRQHEILCRPRRGQGEARVGRQEPEAAQPRGRTHQQALRSEGGSGNRDVAPAAPGIRPRGQIAVFDETIKSAEDRVRRTELRSPVYGIINRINVTTVGAVVQPGANLMDIVPLDDTLLVEGRLRPQDIAFIRPGQDAVVKLTAYDSSVFGSLKGKVERISADTIIDDKSKTGDKPESFYRVMVRTDKNYLGTQGNPLPIIPGMVATVEVLHRQEVGARLSRQARPHARRRGVPRAVAANQALKLCVMAGLCPGHLRLRGHAASKTAKPADCREMHLRANAANQSDR
jgi:hypothetical protein